MDKFYFYFDEGGIIGNATAIIKSKPIRKTQGAFGDPNHISNYFFGRLSFLSICSHLYLFHTAFPQCIILFDCYTHKSDVTPTKEQWSTRPSM